MQVTELTSHNQQGLDCRVWLGGADAGLQINLQARAPTSSHPRAPMTSLDLLRPRTISRTELQGVEQAKKAAASHCGQNDRGELECDDLISAQYNVARGSRTFHDLP